MKDWNYNLRRGFAWQILVALLIATPVSVSATTTSGQVSVDTDDAVILSASIQFTTESSNTGGSPSTRIVGHDMNNAGTFVEQSNDISGRTTTSASVVWNIPQWPTDGESSAAQRTPDLSEIIQEIIDRPGHSSGNPIVLIFEPNGGDDTRLVWSYDGGPASAAELTVEYTLYPGGVVTSSADSGLGSLRECFVYANENPGSTITFDMPATAAWQMHNLILQTMRSGQFCSQQRCPDRIFETG